MDSVRETKRLRMCLKELQLLIRENGNIHIPCEEEKFIIKFIRAKKFDIEGAFKMIKNYFNMRKANPQYFVNLFPSTQKPFLDIGFEVILKKRDNLGRKIVVFRTDLWDPYKVDLDQIISSIVLLAEEVVESEETQRNGMIFLVDETGLGLKHFRDWSVQRMMSIISFFQGNFPMLCKGIHSVNEPYLLKRFVSCGLALLPKKIQERVHFHGKDLESLHKHIPSEILPISLGGTMSWEEATDQELLRRLYSREEHYRTWNSA